MEYSQVNFGNPDKHLEGKKSLKNLMRTKKLDLKGASMKYFL